MHEPQDVQSRHDLAAFIEGLVAELKCHPERRENATLPDDSGTLAAYLRDLDGWCRNNASEVDPELARWRLLAVALVGASVYE